MTPATAAQQQEPEKQAIQVRKNLINKNARITLGDNLVACRITAATEEPYFDIANHEGGSIVILGSVCPAQQGSKRTWSFIGTEPLNHAQLLSVTGFLEIMDNFGGDI